MSNNKEFFRETMERILRDVMANTTMGVSTPRVLPMLLFSALADNGILAMLATEDAGGIGASLSETMTILRAAGDAAAPGPLLETILANALLGKAGRPLANGPVTLALLPEGLAQDEAPLVLQLPWAGLVETILLVAPAENGAIVVETSSSKWQIAVGEDAAGEPNDIISEPTDLMANHFTIDLSFDEILRRTSILRAGQMLGAMEWSYRRSVEYAMERQQFGREIGKFQVVQQMLADLADHVLAATVLLEAAAESNSLMMAGAARSRLADATDCAITVSHQVHGAMGFSVEYALNHRTRRMMAWRDTYGSVPYWRRAVGNVLAISDRETLWHTLTATAQT